MKNKEIQNEIDNKYKYLQENGYNVIFLGLQGSQNYGLDVYDQDYKSDIDTKAIVLPTFKDIVLNKKPISTTLVLDNNEHIDVKDIRLMFETFKKQNINFIEILFTQYNKINPEYADLIDLILNKNEEIARLNYNQGLRCIAGMSMEKLKALQHPYPNLIDKIEKYGYDPKQLHHILRMNDFIKKFIAGKTYQECLVPDNKDYLIQIKKGALSCEEAVELANKTDAETKQIMQDNLLEEDKINKETIALLEDIQYQVLKRAITKEIGG